MVHNVEFSCSHISFVWLHGLNSLQWWLLTCPDLTNVVWFKNNIDRHEYPKQLQAHPAKKSEIPDTRNTRWFWKKIGYGLGIAKNYRVGSGIGYPSGTALVANAFMTSGQCTWASLFSGLSSILVIAKVGVETFLNDYVSELSEASFVGKICIAASVFPVFLLTALFKIGSIAIVNMDGIIGPSMILLALGIPGIVIFVIKSCVLPNDLKLPRSHSWAFHHASLASWSTC